MRLDAEFFCENIVTFRPQNVEEAAEIQCALFELGPCWSAGIPKVCYLNELVREGMTVAEGQIFVGIDARDAASAVACDARDLGIVCESTVRPVHVALSSPKVAR